MSRGSWQLLNVVTSRMPADHSWNRKRGDKTGTQNSQSYFTCLSFHFTHTLFAFTFPIYHESI